MNRILSLKLVQLSLTVCLFSTFAHAAITSCAGDSLATIIAATGSTPANGCGAIDQGFNAFTVATGTSSTFTVDTPAPTTAQITLTATGTTSDVTGIFTSIQSTNNTQDTGWGLVDSTKAHAQVTDLNFEVNANSNSIYPPGQKITGADALVLGSVNIIAAGGATVPVGSEILVVETLCLGATASTGCNANNEVSISIKYTNDDGTTNTTDVKTLSASCLSSVGVGCVADNTAGTLAFTGVANLFVQDIITIGSPSGVTTGDYTVQFNTLQYGFDELVPEPATFGLMGAALFGIGLLSLRKRK